jgi:hypothetical protein
VKSIFSHPLFVLPAKKAKAEGADAFGVFLWKGMFHVKHPFHLVYPPLFKGGGPLRVSAMVVGSAIHAATCS